MSQARKGPKLSGLAYVDYLGGGGFGDVYLYENVGLRRKEAVKIIREGELSDVAVAQFMAEADAMAGLEHPHIVLVYETGTVDDGRPYLRMQYYSGGTMEVRAADGRLSIAEVLRTGVEIGGALETAHRAGLLHRDIKPANILVSAWGTTVYSDVHLGNCRTFVSFDIIYRYLIQLGYKVRYVRNITDVGHLEGDADEGEDKVSKKARLEKVEPMEVVQR